MSREITLGRNCEVDGHAVRKVYISERNPNYKKAIKEACKRAKQLTPAQKRVLKDSTMKKPASILCKRPASAPRRPRVFQLHIRWAGVCTRGGLVVVRPMPSKLVPCGSAPPKESQADIHSSMVMTRIPPRSFVFGDGNVGIKNEAEYAGLTYEEVIHGLMQFTGKVKHVKRGQSVIKGTQTIDRWWDMLDSYIPRTLHTTVKKNGHNRANPDLVRYIYSWLWRTNMRVQGYDLFHAFGDLCRML
jgi:hypothetical protein